ncbi:MAG: beta-propeller domain-containing protein, partial [Nitrosarchaeum sp.]|nr:beta-propeller domain-containing protein [Nitrosarchaeum sp.]
QTNVQVLGIDEPDMIKTNGQELFVSGLQQAIYYDELIDKPRPMSNDVESDSDVDSDVESVISISNPKFALAPDYMPYRKSQNLTQIIDVSDPKNLGILDEIKDYGDLLLNGDILVIFSGNNIFGYDVSDRNDPKRKWEINLKDSQVMTSRLYNGKLYIVTNSYNYDLIPCPLSPFEINGKEMSIPCTDVYRPDVIVPYAVTYHALIIDPNSGDMKNSLSFVGSGQSSAIYMSQDNLYITYTFRASEVDLVAGFLKDNIDVFPNETRSKILKLADLEISNQAKQVELEQIINKYTGSLDKDERVKFENDLRNLGQKYLDKHSRELESTGIVSINLDSFKIENTGKVPGHLLNQFSLDEYKGNLRVATTIGEQWFGRFGQLSQSENDIYVLDADLDVIGELQGLGLTEQIYSARFIGDTGYIVTFRQTDPFYVIDLSNPKNPEMKGELKIPGYSSYLHPLKDKLILGIGRENGQVKLSLFDVSDPSNPKEKDKYTLTEYYSDIESNYRAFLQDADNEVFFIPGSQSAYIFIL